MLCRAASETERIRRASAGAADHERRRCLSAQAAGAGRALHYGEPGAGHGSETVGGKAGGTRWQERKKESDCGGGKKAGGPAAPFVGDGRRIRAAEEQSGNGESGLRDSVLS